MAHFMVLALSSWSQLSISRSDLIDQVKQAEKNVFPRHEAMNLNVELMKRNIELIAVVDDTDEMSRPVLVAYLILTRIHRTALLHKLCVLEKYRRRGIANKLLNTELERLHSRGCAHVQLWVDENRGAAIELYRKVGFMETERVENYYALGRTGIKMVLPLLPS